MINAKYILIFVFTVLLGILLGSFFFGADEGDNTNGSDTPDDEIMRVVETLRISELSNENGTVLLAGTVRSRSEAQLRAEVSGVVRAVYVEKGDTVSAGAVLAEIENASQRATLQQAAAGLASAEASLKKAQNGTREEDLAVLRSNSEAALRAYEEALASGADTAQNAYTIADDAIRNKISDVFSRPSSNNFDLKFISSNSQLATDIEWQRLLLESELEEWEEEQSNISSRADMITVLSTAKNRLERVRKFLDDLALLVNPLLPSENLQKQTIDAWKASLIASRSQINSGLSGISAARGNITARESARDIANANLAQGISGTRPEDIATLEASVASALAVYRSAQSNVEKTLLRSPISGTVNMLDIEPGDFAQAFSTGATVANNSALEIVSFVSESDLSSIQVGSDVVIRGFGGGTVTRIAPSVDSSTGKVEIVIGVQDISSELVNGQNVRLEVVRSQNDNNRASYNIFIPLSALKVGVEQTVVFTVQPDGILMAHPVELGRVSGDRVFIESGIESTDEIVLDARGLNEGDRVEIR